MDTPGQVNPFAGMAISQAQAATLRTQLEMLAQRGTDPRIRELARDVLTGKTDLRAAILGPKYQDLLDQSMRSFSTWFDNLSEAERADQERQARDYQEKLRHDAAAEQSGPRPPRRPSNDGDEDWGPPTILKRRR